MTIKEKENKCKAMFHDLREYLGDDYERTVSGTINRDYYLYPAGTRSDISYHGKPSKSFRLSFHWNWLTDLNKCNDPNYIQCESVDMPRCRKRSEDGKPTKPMYGYQIAFYGNDNKYHCVYGDKYNRKSAKWEWVENTLDDILALSGFYDYEGGNGYERLKKI